MSLVGRGENLLSQKLSRSKKTLVKSNAAVSRETKNDPIPRKSPIVVDDEDEEEVRDLDAKLSSKQPSPKKVKHESPVKPTQVHSSPAKTQHNKSPSKKSNYREFLQKRAAGPIAPGSKEIPKGNPNCLLGLAFVFTGELESLSREEAQDLVKRYGGRTTGAPSGKTSYVVVGEGAGESKLEKVRALGIKTLSEDGLLDLIRHSKATQEEEEYTEDEIIKTGMPKSPTSISKEAPKLTMVHPKMSEFELWTEKYAPQTEDELIGNNSNYEKLMEWLRTWTPQMASTERAVLISGPPGIGKTTVAHMASKQVGLDIVEMNASDTRNKSALHDDVMDMIDNRSLSGFSAFFPKNEPKPQYRKHVLIMDEVDGMSSGDRGGMVELIQLIKKTKIPIICICNDRSSPKVRSLANYCLDLRFRRPDARMITPRITAIAQKEGLRLGVNTVGELVNSTHGDIRQILNILSTYRLTESSLDYDKSKAICESGQKDVEMGPFDAVSALLGSGYGQRSLLDRIDLYFVDSSLVPLMIQENYLKVKANTPRIVNGRAGSHSFMELVSAAADSISAADIVESLIRGANQEWSLAPLHAVMSCVHPAYYCHGLMGGRIEFASWLGNNSKLAKNNRLLSELAKHSYLRTTINTLGLRLDYLPDLAMRLLIPLLEKGVEGVDEVISVLDTYSFSREDFDSILELMIDPGLSTAAYSKVPTAVKTAFTRKYNQGVHKLPYAMGKATSVHKKVPDMDLPNGGNEGAEEEESSLLTTNNGDTSSDDDQDIAKDKMIKMKTLTGKRAAPAGISRARKRRHVK